MTGLLSSTIASAVLSVFQRLFMNPFLLKSAQTLCVQCRKSNRDHIYPLFEAIRQITDKIYEAKLFRILDNSQQKTVIPRDRKQMRCILPDKNRSTDLLNYYCLKLQISLAHEIINLTPLSFFNIFWVTSSLKTRKWFKHMLI